jgi:hypothetical protein
MYPTLEQVNEADHYDICKWWRLLPPPGVRSDGRLTEEIQSKEIEIMNRIAERFKEFGGFTPEISKDIGWGDIYES